MTSAPQVPAIGDVFIDARGGARVLRVSWHTDAEVVVLSLWRDNTCAGTFRLRIDEVPALIEMLRDGLDVAYAEARHFLPMRDPKGLAG